MSKIQNAVVKFGAKMLMNEKQEVSFMKLGGNLCAIAGVILTMPSMGMNVSIDILNVSKLIIAFGAAMGVAGARDAVKK